MSNLQVEPITFRQHLLNPFSFKVTGAKNYTAMIPVRHRIVALVAAIATAILGIPFAVVGGPLVFYFFTRQFKNRRIEQIQQNNVPRPPTPDPQPPVGNVGPVVPPVGTRSALLDACARGRIDEVRTLINRRANLSVTDNNGNNGLHLAAMNGHPAIVQLLLANGADANSRNHAWKTPLACSIEKVIPSVVANMFTSTQQLLNMACNSPRARENLDRLVEALQPFAKYDVVRNLMNNQNLTASMLLDRLMLSVLKKQHLTQVGDPLAYDKMIREQPFIFTLNNNEVTIFTQDNVVDITKQQFYHVWVQYDGNLNNMKTRILEHHRQPIHVPVPVAQPVAGGNRFIQYNGPVFSVIGDEYNVLLTRDDFKAKPEMVLEKLSNLFDQNKVNRLKVKYPEENGADAGGLRRQFVADIFSQVSDKLQFQKFANGLIRPKSRETNREFPNQNASDKKACENLGKMIMFCLNAAEQYPTGLVFDPGTFVALTKMDAKFLNRKFEDIDFKVEGNFKEMFDLYKKMNEHDEDEKNKNKRSEKYLNLTAASSDDDLKGAFGLVMADDAIDVLKIQPHDVAKMKQHLAAIKTAVKDSIIDEMKGTFAPIHAIATGMKNSGFDQKARFDDVRRKNAADLSKQLQGIATKQEIIDRLTVNNGVDIFGMGLGAQPISQDVCNKIKGWMTNWINNADPKKLELFLFAATGSPALGNNTRIMLKHANAFTYHTCSCTIDMNFNVATEQELHGILDAGLVAIQHSPIFDVV